MRRAATHFPFWAQIVLPAVSAALIMTHILPETKWLLFVLGLTVNRELLSEKRPSRRRLVKYLVGALISVGVSASTAWMVAQRICAPSPRASPEQVASYVVFIDSGDGSRIKAKNIVGTIDFSHESDAANVVQSTITTLAASGGTIYLMRGTYNWASVPAFQSEIPHWLKVVCEGGVVVRLSETGPRLFNFDRRADYDTFQNIWIQGFTVDCNNIGGKGHVVLGTTDGTGGYQMHLNLQDIMVREIRTINVPVDSTLTNNRLNVWLCSVHRDPGEMQTKIQRIYVEDCYFSGGNKGCVIAGTKTGPARTGFNVFLDDIHIHRCRHSLGTVQAGDSFSGSNFHIGSFGFGGSCHIADCHGEYSGDVGVEINGMAYALVENTEVVDASQECFLHTNTNATSTGRNQCIVFRDCRAVRRTEDSNKRHGYRFGTTGTIELGTVLLDNCSYYSNAPGLVEGEAIRFVPTSGARSFVVRNFHLTIEGLRYAAAETGTYRPILLNPTGGTTTTSVTVTGMDITIRGKREQEAGVLEISCMELDGTQALSLDEIRADMDLTNSSRSGLVGISVGSIAPTVLSGSIRRFIVTQMTDDTAPIGIRIEGTAQLVIKGQLRIEECDFSAMTGGTEVLFTTADHNKDLVFFYGNRWITFPASQVEMKVGSSPFTYRNLDGYIEYITVQGGEVKQIAISRDGETFQDTGVTAGLFTVENADYFRVTYASAPTMTKTPAK